MTDTREARTLPSGGSTEAREIDTLAERAAPESRWDPYAPFNRLRENDPVHRASQGFYMVTRHADARVVPKRANDLFPAPEAEMMVAALPRSSGTTRWRSR